MAHNDSPDSEFDPEMERILREHFDAEDSNLRAPNDPWPWLESRMEELAMPSFFSRLLGYLNPMRNGRLSPAFAVAGVAVVAVAVAVVVWAASGDGWPEGPGGLAVVPATEVPASTVYPSAEPAATTAPSSATAQSDRQPLVAQDPAGPAGEHGAQGASDRVAPSATTAAPAPTTVLSRVEVTRVANNGEGVVLEEEVAEEEEAPAAMAAPASEAMATPAPPATATPAPPAMSAQPQATAQNSAALRGPREPAGAQGSDGADGAMGPAGSPTEAAIAAGGTPSDTNFRDYQRQPFVAASEDNVSTFSLDTDRTSFQLALSWAHAGYEVNPDSVRAEEWLNAFNYEYEPPSRSDGFAIRGDLYPHPLDESKRLARIGFQAPELVDDKPLNVTLVLDASGSMADGNRVDIARQAAESIRRSLRPNDRIAVVHFTDDVVDQYTVEHRPPDDRQVRDSINRLAPHGSTNVQAGLNLGVRLAGEARTDHPDAHNYVILMSDGVANVDATDPFAILETAYDPDAGNPLRLITVGVGINNYNDVLLEQLAQHGNGWYRYLDSVDQARAAFTRENWLALSIPFADQTRAQVTWNTGTVERWRIIGYENRVTADENFTQDRKEFAEIYSGAATTVLYELELTDAAESLSTVRLGSVELRWVDPDAGDSRSQTATLSGNPAAGFDGENGPLAQFGAIVALAADLYGGLPNYPEGAYSQVHAGLSTLLHEFQSLRKDLGSLDAYTDFLFLLEHIAADVSEMTPQTPSGTGSGYNR